VSISIDCARLLDYSEHERAKWKTWIAADPLRLALPFQAGGRFPTVASLFDHLFLVERRHLSRLEGGVPPEATGIPQGDWQALFEYGDLVRADLRHYAEELDAAEADEVLTFTLQGGGTFSITRRKLVTHMVLHEVRHLAQLAYAARLAGLDPPGDHDYLFFSGD
jgi:uncharacterized damage-inducible protein DinB